MHFNHRTASVHVLKTNCHRLTDHYVLRCLRTSLTFIALLVSAPPPKGYITAPVFVGYFYAIQVYQRHIEGKPNREEVLKSNGDF